MAQGILRRIGRVIPRIAIPLEPIPGIDLLYNVGVPIVLVW